ncbi:hypothetical protein DEU56DRAFT_754948 [Suillus clintonianus]|uniref:uncharacterized protein n=1 Tax=Suillus clintonianus TaxID=1904413 RepID=UPI001B85DCA6|nr:uncharacterized protein DEU56DRAFT_754948 [Suillus clintonianus]KAG2141229.1 hypothetical protein DEU56DRAFT_754948 [Suillus clintonianus]
MARSGHSTQLTSTSGRHRVHQPQTQKLMENEISELKNYLPEWTLAKRNEKRAVFTAIARAARLFAPKVDQAQWKKRKQKKKERKDMIKYGRKWTPRQVIYQQKWEEVLKRIENESGAKPGGPGMFKHYQAAVKRVMAELSDNELEKAKETAEEWSNNFLPPKIQAQVARKKGPAYIEHFSKEMWRQCGDERGEVLFGMRWGQFMKTKDWEDIEPVWQGYAQEQFGICSGIDKAVVPWSAIIQSQDDFVARKYVPVDVDLKEPSKLQHLDTTALLNFCMEEQRWKNRDGDMVASVVSGNSPSHRTRKVSRDMILRPWNSATETDSDPESNPEGDFHHMEDDADDDAVEGRSPQKRPRTEPGPSTAHEGTAVPRAITKPHPVNAWKTGALLTLRMGDLLAGLTERVTGNVQEDGATKGINRSPAPKNMRGKKAVIEPLVRTTRKSGLSPTIEARLLSSDY